jgi:DNA-binding transcriptional LysR family regulator
MRANKVDLNLFVVFDVIYRERNLTRAAQVLCLTQPTVSNALSRLRKTFNDQLFVRTPQGMAPTPVANNIVGQVRQALQLLDASVQAGDQFSAASSERVFRMSMNDRAESALLPRLMDTLSHEAPGMRLESYYTRRRELATALSSGQLELAIDIPAAANADICHQPLFCERYVCVVRDSHTLLQNRRKLTLEQYLQLGHIHVSSRRQGLGLVDIELNKLGHQRNIRVRLQHYLVVSEIVRRTDLALTVPSHWVNRPGLKVFELPFIVPELEWHLLWHKSADGDQANRWLREKVIALSAESR